MKQRILALDIGDKRIGVAATDEDNIIATGIGVIERETLERDIEKIKNYVKEYNIGKIVVGLPLTMKGTESAQTLKVKEVITVLEQNAGVAIISFDERLTTAQGERMLINADISRKKRKKVIDKIAAQLILQAYLEGGGL